MDAVLVDSSAWVEYLRNGKGATCDSLDDLLVQGRAALCGVVEMELLAGVRARERTRLETLLAACPYVETRRAHWIAAGAILATHRARGVTLPPADALIAAICLSDGLPLLTLDAHFGLVQGLKLVD